MIGCCDRIHKNCHSYQASLPGTDMFVHESIEFCLYHMLSDARSYLIGTSANTELIQSV